MAQVTVYLPDEVAKGVRRAARKAGKSVSAFLADLAVRSVKPPRWPASFGALEGETAYGAWAGDPPVVADPHPDPIDAL